MRVIIALFVFCVTGSALAQSDTLLYNGFDSIVYFNPDQLDPSTTHSKNFKGWYNYTKHNEETIDVYDSLEIGSYYTGNWFAKWHVFPYIERIDTTLGNPITYDTITNHGARSISWFSPATVSGSVLVTPHVWLGDNQGTLKWKSMPQQGPRYQDGYQVYIIDGDGIYEDNFDPNDYTPVFEMQEMTSTPPPATTDSSLAKIMRNNGFEPIAATAHTNYTLPAPTGSGLVDSSRQNPWMQEFEVSLSAYSGLIQIIFYHYTHDDVAIFLDDILVLGNGAVGIDDNELGKNDFQIYPNPATNEINLRMEDATEVTSVRILDVQGKLVQEFLNPVIPFNFNISSIENGSYQLEVLSKYKKVSKSFMITK